MRIRRFLATAPIMSAALAGCASEGELVLDQGVGVTAIRSVCPAVGIPDYTGDVTLFRVPGDLSAANIDVVASMTNVRSTCNESEGRVYNEVTFDVLARRTNVAGARVVELPYFDVVVQGGTAVQSKRVGTVAVQFADGQERGRGRASAGAYIDRAAATLPPDIREKITRKRKAGDPDAALDPLADPAVRTAVRRATFEQLVGFQLTEEQLAYNATR